MIAYFKGKSFFSRLIKWRTWGQYSHVAWIVDRDFDCRDQHGERTIIPAGTIYESWIKKSEGAARSGVRKGMIGDLHTPGTPMDLYAIKISDQQYTRMIQELERWVQEPDAKYDFRAVLSGFILRKGSAHSENRLFCSEFLMRVFRAASFRFLINIESYQTSPSDMSHSPNQLFVGERMTGSDLDVSLRPGLR